MIELNSKVFLHLLICVLFTNTSNVEQNKSESTNIDKSLPKIILTDNIEILKLCFCIPYALPKNIDVIFQRLIMVYVVSISYMCVFLFRSTVRANTMFSLCRRYKDDHGK